MRTGTGYQQYTGCQVDGVFGTVTIGAANMGWTIQQSAGDMITNWGYGFQNCFPPTSCNSPTRVASRQTESGTSIAYAKYQSDVSSSTGGSWNVWVQINVGRDKYWETNS